MTVQDLLDLREHISISRHEPGKLQLKFGLGIINQPAVRELKSLSSGASHSPALISSSLNIFARSINLEYDTALVPPEAVDQFFSSSDPAEIRNLAGQVAALFGVNLNLA